MNIPYDSPELNNILEALANQKRRGMVHELSLQPSTITKLARQFELSLPAIHKHISFLEEAKLIIRKKAGRTNFIALDQDTLKLAQSWFAQYQTHWGTNKNATLENYISSLQE